MVRGYKISCILPEDGKGKVSFRQVEGDRQEIICSEKLVLTVRLESKGEVIDEKHLLITNRNKLILV